MADSNIAKSVDNLAQDTDSIALEDDAYFQTRKKMLDLRLDLDMDRSSTDNNFEDQDAGPFNPCPCDNAGNIATTRNSFLSRSIGYH